MCASKDLHTFTILIYIYCAQKTDFTTLFRKWWRLSDELRWEHVVLKLNIHCFHLLVYISTFICTVIDRSSTVPGFHRFFLACQLQLHNIQSIVMFVSYFYADEELNGNETSKNVANRLQCSASSNTRNLFIRHSERVQMTFVRLHAKITLFNGTKYIVLFPEATYLEQKIYSERATALTFD